MDEFALVYEAGAARGFRPRDCDEMEIWELASALGANRPDEDADPLRDADGMNWAQRRAYALEHGLPEPQWDDVPMTAAEIAQQQKLVAVVPPMFPPDEGAPS